jgi:hypothetical protein
MMAVSHSGQTYLVQLETAFHRLVESFWEEPYRYFTEADAVVGLQSWVAKRPELAQTLRTADGFETSLLHREYPTFFCFSQSDPSARLPPPARRGHYDLALLNPAHIQQHKAETVANRNIEDRGDLSCPPLLAVVEFKLFGSGLNPSQIDDVREALGKLRLALQPPDKGEAADAEAAYLCIFQRDVSGRQDLWKRRWPGMETALEDYADIRAVVAVWWPEEWRDPFVHYGGPWSTIEE